MCDGNNDVSMEELWEIYNDLIKYVGKENLLNPDELKAEREEIEGLEAEGKIARSVNYSDMPDTTKWCTLEESKQSLIEARKSLLEYKRTHPDE